MNIFFLDLDPQKCAEYHVDRHATKMQTESCQMLSSAYPKGVAPYKHTHFNHGMTVWTRTSLENFQWALDYAFALCDEYTFRYEKNHKTRLAANWYKNNLPDLPKIGLTDPPRCFSEWKGKIPETDSVVNDYREFYRVGKTHLFNWKKRSKPEWLH
jgi:hypothetical protein